MSAAAPGRVLFFDSSGFDWLELALIDFSTNALAHQKVRLRHFDSEKTLPALLAFLKKNRIKPTNSGPRKITKIYFVSGPGSFSGIRVGASIALALGFGWNVPVFALKKMALPKKNSSKKTNSKISVKAFAKILARAKAKKISAVPELDYGAPPKITKEKKKKLRQS